MLSSVYVEEMHFKFQSSLKFMNSIVGLQFRGVVGLPFRGVVGLPFRGVVGLQFRGVVGLLCVKRCCCGITEC